MPRVVPWFNVYCGLMALLYLGVAAASLVLWFVPPHRLGMGPDQARLMGIVCLLLGLPLCAAFLLPFVKPRARWMWGYGIALIAIGMTSACCMLACVPLLIFWVRPEAKAWFTQA